MEIDLSQHDREIIASLIKQGRFESPVAAVSAGLSLIQDEESWRQYAQERLDAGAKAFAQNDFATDDQLDALFAEYVLKSA
jgi:Arc/MetJ-type ribon-helix-helix transcriptional regulator